MIPRSVAWHYFKYKNAEETGSGNVSLTSEVMDLMRQLSAAEREVEDLKGENNLLKRQMSQMQQQQERHLRHSYESDILLHGVPETKGENCTQVLQGLLSTQKAEHLFDVVENTHRLGRSKASPSPRPIVVRLTKRLAKPSFFQAFKNCESKIRVTDHLTPGDFKKKLGLKEVMSRAWQEKKKVVFRQGELFIDGKRYVDVDPKSP